MKNIGIIGADGFIGKNLLLELNKNLNLNIFVFKGYKRDNKNFSYSIKEFFKNNPVAFDIIYYLASSTNPASSYNNPIFEIDQNLTLFIEFMEIATKNTVKKIVFSSSAGTVYGDSKNTLSEESQKSPKSPHAIVKLTIEYFLFYYLEKKGINFDIFRISNVYGENQNTSRGLGIINTIIERSINDERIDIFGDGENVRNYIYVKDVVKGMILSIERPLEKSNIFNLASTNNYSINEIIQLIQKIIPHPIKLNYLPERKSDLKMIKIDNSKFLNYFPEFNFTKIDYGISKTYNFIKQQKK